MGIALRSNRGKYNEIFQFPKGKRRAPKARISGANRWIQIKYSPPIHLMVFRFFYDCIYARNLLARYLHAA